MLSPHYRLALLAIALAPALACAQGTPPVAGGSAAFAQHKQRELARIASHLQALQTLQSCVQSATDHAAVKACNEAARAAIGRAS
jgi:hypothetical protein